MSKQGSSFKDVLQNVFAVSAILIAFVVSYILFTNVMGNPVNFEGGNHEGQPLEGNFLGIIYKGGFIVPVLMTCVLVLIIFIFERINNTFKSKRKRQAKYIRQQASGSSCSRIKLKKQWKHAIKQKGSLANVMKAGLSRYRDLQKDKDLEKDQKILSIQKSFRRSYST